MDEQQADGWQMPLWTEDNTDQQWFSDFLAVDSTHDLVAPAPTTSSINNITIPSLPVESGATDDFFSLGEISSFSSPGCTLYPTSSQPMAHFERSLEQRQHSLPRRRSKYLLRRIGSGGRSSPTVIPSGSPQQGAAHSLAIQRWQDSPPDEEAASLSAIYNALESRPSSMSGNTNYTQRGDAFYKHRGVSSTTSIDSGVSDSSLRSNNSSHSTASQTNRRTQTSKSRTKAKSKQKNMNTADRIFKCTFCCDTFKHKYDWARHEKSLHLNMEEWICTPFGGSVILPLTGRVHCAYCSALDPTSEHLQQHNHSACSEGRTTPRVFRRKDHLVQHLRLVHGLDTLPLIEDWKVEAMPVVSRCGFCKTVLESWDERTDHLAAHFRNGKTMADWQGDHGFDPAVNSRLTKAFPPYLIASQAATLVPFSATDPASIDHTNQLLSRIELEALETSTLAEPAAQKQEPLPTQQEMDTALFADILTRHLSRFARQQVQMGIMPTDEMFQRESRRLLYHDEDDAWNQTVADDPKWMQEFKQRTGFGGKPDV